MRRNHAHPTNASRYFHDLVSGRRRGLLAATARGLLSCLELPYAAAMRFRNWRYDRGQAKSSRVEVPVLSVGNLTLGGTGKSPMVAWLCRWLRHRDLRVTVISRGYKASDGARNDEALELERKLPDVPHLQNPDRVAAARTAIDDLECQLIVLDDAFQHRRIERDLDIVLIDATEPFGWDHVFPRGTLREPLAGFARADVVALSRADMLSTEAREQVRQRVARYAPNAIWLELAHRPHALIQWPDREQPIESLEGKSVAAFCGIGNPDGFRHTLAECGYEVAAFRPFPDHHGYSRDDIAGLTDWASETRTNAIVCTHKDLVKIAVAQLAAIPLYAIGIELQILRGQTELEGRLEQALKTRKERKAE